MIGRCGDLESIPFTDGRIGWRKGAKIAKGRHLLGDIGVIGVLLLVSSAFLIWSPLTSEMRFALGSVGPPVTQGFHVGETTSTGQSFRWTDGNASLHVPPQAATPHMLWLTISAPWPDTLAASVPVTITINDRPVLAIDQTAAPRRYAFLVPAKQLRLSDTVVRIESPVFAPTEVNRNERQLGVAVFDIDWRAVHPSSWLVPLQILLIAGLAVLFYRMLVVAGIPFWARVLALVLLLAITLTMRHTDSRFIYRWHAVLVTLGLNLILAAVLLLLRGWRAEPVVLPVWPWMRQHGLALAGYALISGVMLFPLVLHFSTHIIGPPGDNYEYLWKMQWFSQALIEKHVSPVFASQMFYPGGTDLTVSEVAPAHHLLGVPLTWLFGPIISYNVMLFASFVLTGFFTYLLAYRLGARLGAAWVAGIIFAFCLRRFFHANGHFGMMGTQWLALTLYGWEGLLTRRRAWDGFVAGLGYVLAAWSSLLYGATLPFFLAAYTLVRVGVWQLPSLLQSWRPIVVMGGIAIALVLPLAQPYYEAKQEGRTFQHTYSQLALHAAVPVAYLLPSPFHPLWGKQANRLYRVDAGEQYVAPGYTVIILTLVGIWAGRRRREVQALAVLIGLNVIMTFGPELQLLATTSIDLPAKWLYEHAPVLGNIRTWARMSIYVMLCAAVLSGLALSLLPGRWYRIGWLVAASLILFESLSVLPLSNPQPRPVDLFVRDLPGNGAVAHLPYSVSGPPYEYYTLLYSGKPVSQGHGKFPPALYREGRDILARFPDASVFRLWQRWQTDYIIVDEAAMQPLNPDWRAEVAALPYVESIYRMDGYSVYRVER